MKTRDDVTADKLRGGFYSPPALVEHCLDRLAALTAGRVGLTALEPSAGDGAFLRQLQAHPLGHRLAALDAVELLPAEAARCREALAQAPFEGHVHTGSVIPWALDQAPRFDLACGNPPFVRYQFLDPADKASIPALADRLGLKLAGVSNLWIPVLFAALSCLRPGGAFAFIIPAECLTGVSAGVVRAWLTERVSELCADVFPPGSFPGVLQEVLILSGRLAAPAGTLEVREHQSLGAPRTWRSPLDPAAPTWTRYLLSPPQRAALDEARALATPLAQLARFEVAIVTGANEFFSVDAPTLEAHGLAPWALPLLPRSRHAPGLVFTSDEHAALAATGHKAHLLHFAADKPDPTASPAARYLAQGEALGLPARYKCAIRTPWYRVPHVRAGRFLLSKRSHAHPRVILNAAGVFTTDTIYRGAMRPGEEARERDFVAAFHNSLTLLTGEIEGRSFGGGVLELVPSEVGRLSVPVPPGFGRHLDALDACSRSGADLVAATDQLLVDAGVGFTPELISRLADARQALLNRRLARG